MVCPTVPPGNGSRPSTGSLVCFAGAFGLRLAGPREVKASLLRFAGACREGAGRNGSVRRHSGTSTFELGRNAFSRFQSATAVRSSVEGESALNTNGRIRSSTAKAGVVALFGSTGILLLATALLVAFLLRPPLLGWVGFALVCAIMVALTAVAAVAFPRLRVSAAQPAAAVDGETRLLVVADEHCGSPGLWKAIDSRLAGAVAVHLVVPVRVSHLHYLTNDESGESREASDRVRLAAGLFSQPGVSVTGGVGSDDPLESITDALAVFPATRVLLATSTDQDSYWLEKGLLAKARRLTPLEVSHVVVPPTASAEPMVRSRKQG